MALRRRQSQPLRKHNHRPTRSNQVLRQQEPSAGQPRVPGKSPAELQLDEIYAKAPAAKAEIDALADSIAKQTGGRVAQTPLKGRNRALEKAIEYEKRGGNASDVKDIARNTIVVERSQYDKAVALLKEQGAKVKSIDSASEPMGYSGERMQSLRPRRAFPQKSKLTHQK